jgi:hypothetical protein
MSHMHHFYVLLKNTLHLELGVGCLYSPSCREGVFSETHIPLRETLCVWTGVMLISSLCPGPIDIGRYHTI